MTATGGVPRPATRSPTPWCGATDTATMQELGWDAQGVDVGLHSGQNTSGRGQPDRSRCATTAISRWRVWQSNASVTQARPSSRMQPRRRRARPGLRQRQHCSSPPCGTRLWTIPTTGPARTGSTSTPVARTPEPVRSQHADDPAWTRQLALGEHQQPDGGKSGLLDDDVRPTSRDRRRRTTPRPPPPRAVTATSDRPASDHPAGHDPAGHDAPATAPPVGAACAPPPCRPANGGRFQARPCPARQYRGHGRPGRCFFPRRTGHQPDVGASTVQGGITVANWTGQHLAECTTSAVLASWSRRTALAS